MFVVPLLLHVIPFQSDWCHYVNLYVCSLSLTANKIVVIVIDRFFIEQVEVLTVYLSIWIHVKF